MRAALSSIAAASEALRSDDRERRLVVSLLPSFAARWLTPRVGRFIERYPELDLELQSTHTLTDFSRDDVDAVIRLGDGNYPGLFSEHLFDESFFPACAPGLNGGRLPVEPRELADMRLLRNDYQMWTAWFREAGLSGWREPRRGVLYQDASQQLQAAIDGQGVGLVRRSLAMQAILDGQLTRLFNVEVPSPFSYWMVCPEPLQEAHRVRALRDWLHDEAQQFRALYETPRA